MLSFAKALTAGLGSALLVVVVMYVVLSGFRFESRAPTDQSLEANFRAHKQKLDSLVEMSRVDGIIRTTNPQPLFSKEQNRQFRDLLRETGVRGDIRHETGPGSTTTTYLICWTRDLITNGTLKGYAYSETELTPVMPSLDDVNSWPKGSKVIFKKLEGNWYLFLMSS